VGPPAIHPRFIYSITLSVNRAKWFRDRASRDRAREEKEILEEEIRRQIKTFSTYASIWTRLADATLSDSTAKASYAFKQAAMYSRLFNEAGAMEKRVEEKKVEYEAWYRTSIISGT
jgi:hypothetical protein